MSPTARNILVLVAIAVVAWVMLGWAVAHSFYDPACCSDKDCYPLPAGVVAETPDGYVLEQTGETIKYDDPRIRMSVDDNFHRCNLGSARFTRCLYVPGRGV